MHAIADQKLGALGDVDDLDVLEYGCGAGQWASSLRSEARSVIGVDLSENQLAAARARDHDLVLVHASGEQLPFSDASFDLVFCDHGAMSWADPARTLPETTRVLRPGGRLVFNVTSPFVELCWRDDIQGVDTTLRSNYFELHGVEEAEGARSYTLGYGDWIRRFRACGLEIVDLIEPRPGSDDPPNTYFTAEPADWFVRFPGECLWVTRLSPRGPAQ